MAAAAILYFLNREILLDIGVEKVETNQRAKFRQNWSISWKDIKIFQFLKMAATAIMDFQICEILFADGVWRAQLYQISSKSVVPLRR